MVVMVMMMMMMVMECGAAELVVTDGLKGPILCWTWPLIHIPNSKSL